MTILKWFAIIKTSEDAEYDLSKHRKWSDNMRIIREKTSLAAIQQEEAKEEMFFEDMVKCVADIDRNLVAVSAELHVDLEELLLEDGSDQKSLYGFNILYEDGEIEFDSMINPPRNREAGYPRAGRDVADPTARKKIEEIVDLWIER